MNENEDEKNQDPSADDEGTVSVDDVPELVDTPSLDDDDDTEYEDDDDDDDAADENDESSEEDVKD